jgi:adenosine deaminase CECR1
MQKDAGVDIPFIFHAGETLGDGTEADDNLYDAILLGTKRIGELFLLSFFCTNNGDRIC